MVRYILSIAVIVAHYAELTHSSYWFPITSNMAVGIFFGLSGFLVYGSFLKKENFRTYFLGRVRRILPPYSAVVLATALLMCSVSSLDVSDYFLSSGFWRYVIFNLGFANFLQPTLPGVLDGQEIMAVNGSLWTLKVEWGLYLSVPLLVWLFRRLKIHFVLYAFVLCIISALYGYGMSVLAEYSGNMLYEKLSYQFVGQLPFFLTGMVVWQYRDRVRENLIRCGGVAVLVIIFALYLKHFEISSYWLELIPNFLLKCAATLVALVISIAPTIDNISRLMGRVGNCSYEMYLLHFPVIQFLIATIGAEQLQNPWVFGAVLMLIFVLSWGLNRSIERCFRKSNL